MIWHLKILKWLAERDLDLAITEVNWAMGKGLVGKYFVVPLHNSFNWDINDTIRLRILESKHAEEELEMIEKHIEEFQNFKRSVKK